MNKKEKYEALCEEVRNCTTCMNINFAPHIENSNCFIHDELVNGETYVNRWNLIQGSLDAEIMVIGQDYGCYDEKYFVTDATLQKLFNDVFEINIKEKNEKLYFTNMANCYRKNKSTGAINTGCLALCTNKFMSRLINIISPKAIVVLGSEAFKALACCDKAKLVCKNPDKNNAPYNFKTIMEHKYSLVFEDNHEIAVFPVYHPGSNGRINRSYDMQKEDWTKVRKYIEGENI